MSETEVDAGERDRTLARRQQRSAIPQSTGTAVPDGLALVAVLVYGALTQFMMLRAPTPSDTLAYFNWAQSITQNPISHGPTRMGVLLPVRTSIELFGPSELAYYAVPIVVHLVMLAGIFGVGSALFSRRVGVLAALAYASTTLVFEYSSSLLPDPFAAAWFTAAVAVLLLSRRAVGRRRLLALALGAGLVGVAYLCREYTVLMAPVLLLIAWRQRWNRTEALTVVGVLVAVFVVELGLMAAFFGDPLARVRAVAGFAGSEGAADVLAAYGADATRWTVLTRAPSSFADYGFGTLLVGVPVVTALLALAGPRRERHAWILLSVGFLSLWVPMMLLAGIIDPSSPRIRDYHIRYWFLVVPVLVIGLVAAADRLVRWVPNPWLRRTSAVAMLLAVMAPLYVDLREVPDELRFRGTGATQYDEVRTWFATRGQDVDVVWTDSRTARVLPLYTVSYRGGIIWDGEIRTFDTQDGFLPADELDGPQFDEAIVVHQLGLRWLRRRDLRLPDEYRELRDAWHLDVSRADGSLWIARVPEDPTGDGPGE